jgi:hypothetical protein
LEHAIDGLLHPSQLAFEHSSGGNGLTNAVKSSHNTGTGISLSKAVTTNAVQNSHNIAKISQTLALEIPYHIDNL